MDDRLINLFNEIGAGTLIATIISLVGFGYLIYKAIKVIREHIVKDVIHEEEDKKDKKDLQTVISKIEDLGKDIDGMHDEVNKNTTTLKNYVDQKYNMLVAREEGNEKHINELKDRLNEQEHRIEQHQQNVSQINENIKILLDSDKQTISAYLIGEHEKYVKKEKEIDLLALQNIEDAYRNYLREDKNGGDPFIEKIMREIRSLPTKR